MLRSLALLFVLLVSLYGQSESELLKRANKLVNSSSKSEQFRAYNDYKNLYLRALMNENKTMKRKALEGIVKSGRKLHIDVSDYAKELANYKKKHPSSIKKKTKLKYKSVQKKKPKKKIYVRSSHKLKTVRWQDGRLVLQFDKKLRNNQINYFTLYDKKTKHYKYIFDIHASMLMRSQTLRKRGIEKIKLAQFNQNTLRLVFENPKKLSIRFKKENNKLIIRSEPKEKKQSKAVLKKRAQRVQAKKAPTRLDRNKVIVIDAGHGGKDPGAIGYRGLKEKDVVLKIAQELRNILRARGYKVYMTRDRDIFIKLRHRTKYANRKKADLFISIHANAVGRKDAKKVQGVECYFLSKSRSARAKRVAAIENSADLNDMNYYGKESFLNTLNYHN
ncbi:MAG: N-acetylmuramoyl-L-alanine amidase, partial [Sulfurimonas sp.]